MITLMGLDMENPLEIPAATMLADIVPMTGNTRRLFATYLVENPKTGRPTYLLPDWETTIQIEAGEKIALRLAFILKKGEHAAFEETCKVYCHFQHAAIQGVYHYMRPLSRRLRRNKNENSKLKLKSVVRPLPS